MIRWVRRTSVAAIFLAIALPLHAEERNLSHDWLFHKGDATSASSPAYDDHAWLKVEVPHDWSIADKPDGGAPFGPHTPRGQDSGGFPDGTGWYRRHTKLRV